MRSGWIVLRHKGFVAAERRGRWGRAAALRGRLAKGGNARVVSVSCTSAGNCVADGDYTDGDGHRQGFVTSEKDTVWGPVTEVPGLGALNQGGNAQAVSVSCAAADSCAAGGYYTDSSFAGQGLVVSETHGVWGQAAGVPGLEALNDGTDQPDALVTSVPCATPGKMPRELC
jgi:hypothetical protein